MDTYQILLIVTSANRMGKSPDHTGSWLEEVVAPYYAFKDARCEVTIASPKGGKAPLDETSLLPEHTTASTRRYDADAKAKYALEQTAMLSKMDLAQFDAVFFAGGHGTMTDFPTDAAVRSAVEYFYHAGKPVAAVCHGPACLVAATKKNGLPLIHGHGFTCFTDIEETQIGYEKSVPFLLESRLRKLGGIARNAAPNESHIMVDGSLITGQNPASSIPVAEAVIHQLRHLTQLQHAA